MNIQARQNCSYDCWEKIYERGGLSLNIHHSHDYLSLAGLENRKEWEYYVLIEESSKRYIENFCFLEHVIDILCGIDQTIVGGLCRPSHYYFPQLILNCSCEVGIRFDHNDPRQCKLFLDKWISQYMIDDSDLNIKKEINIYQAKTYVASYLKYKIEMYYFMQKLQNQKLFFPSSMLKIAFIDLFTKNFEPVPLNIKRKCFLKYFKIIMKLEKQQVMNLHLACCLIKLLEKKVNRDLKSLRIYLQGTNEKICIFYSNYLYYIQQNCSTISEATYQLVEGFPQVGKYKYLKTFLSLNYFKISDNNYRKWDMSPMASLLQRFPEHANIQRFTLLYLLNICYERSKNDLQREYKYRNGQIGVVRKVDEFWTVIDAAWPNLINHIFDI